MGGSTGTVIFFIVFVLAVLVISYMSAARARSSKGYYAAGGQIHWAVNGVAFGGDYLSAASFLGICGLIAVSGYDGFLYSIGYLAGWIVALFLVAAPIRRLGRYTLSDALDAKFDKSIVKLMAAISTLVVSICYLIPQMVGAGVLITPLLGWPHWAGVVVVGSLVIAIVATAGMTSTTYVQFLKGSLLVLFSTVLVVLVLFRGLSTEPDQGGKVPFKPTETITATDAGGKVVPTDPAFVPVGEQTVGDLSFVALEQDGVTRWWKVQTADSGYVLTETHTVETTAEGSTLIDGRPASDSNQLPQVGNLVALAGKTGAEARTGAIDPVSYLAEIGDPETIVQQWKKAAFAIDGGDVTVYYSTLTSGAEILRPGLAFKVEGTPLERLDFVSLMVALFLGTASLPHILIRYYTVPTQACARKSTLVAICVIGFFYILTLYMGLGAMTSGTINPADNNMSAPLLARSFGDTLFAAISAIAFATVLGTVAGLIIASSGAVAHDLMDRLANRFNKSERQKVLTGRASAFVIGGIAIVLGILFKGMNVSFLVGLAFAIAASANLPAILAMLFWKRATSKGIGASIGVGIVSSLLLIALSPALFEMYGADPASAPIPFNNPGIVSIPLAVITLVAVSLLTRPDMKADPTSGEAPAEVAVAES
jgi:cation/acetate symporter